MIEVKDRIPTYPGRVKLSPVSGQANTYDMVRADDPIEPGTPINKVLLDSKANVLTKDVTLYVDSTTGNDSTGDGSSAKPFKTIQKAVNSVPKVLGGHTATILTASGTYEEVVAVDGYQGGLLVIGDNTQTVTLRGAILVNASSFVVLRILNITSTGYDTVSAKNGSQVKIEALMTLDGASNYASAFWAEGGSTITTYEDLFDFLTTTIKNFKSPAVYAIGGSKIQLSVLEGSNNSTGLRAEEGGVIIYNINNMTATTATTTYKGGRIYSGAQTSIPKY